MPNAANADRKISWTRFALLGALVFIPLLLAGAWWLDRPGVRVIDAATGRPLAGAQVVRVFPSLNDAPRMTDGDGVVRFGLGGLPPGGWLEISKSGYQPEHVDLGAAPPKRLEVRLQPLPSP